MEFRLLPFDSATQVSDIALVMDSKALATRTLVILGIVSLLLLAGCGGGTSQSVNTQPVNNQPPVNILPPPPTVGTYPFPTIQILFPSFAPAGEPVQL